MTPDLAGLLPEAARALGIGAAPDWLTPTRSVVVLLVDGLGWRNLEAGASEHAIARAILQTPPVGAPLPSTTPVSLATFGLGSNPGHHGVVGATFALPEFGQVLRPLSWDQTPAPEAVQPDPTWFERIAASDVDVVRIGPSAYANSGLTTAALRGGRHVAGDDLAGLVAAVIGEVAGATKPQLVYAYYPTLDKVGHVHGADSDQWRAEAAQVLTAIETIRQQLPSAATLIVTADHGMLDVERRVWIEDRPELLQRVHWLAGEPRFRHVYAQPGQGALVLSAWRTLEEFADVYARDDFLAKYWPDAEEFAAERVGDVVAVARDATILASRTFDSKVSSLAGLHGGETAVERDIPMAVLAG